MVSMRNCTSPVAMSSALEVVVGSGIEEEEEEEDEEGAEEADGAVWEGSSGTLTSQQTLPFGAP